MDLGLKGKVAIVAAASKGLGRSRKLHQRDRDCRRGGLGKRAALAAHLDDLLGKFDDERCSCASIILCLRAGFSPSRRQV